MTNHDELQKGQYRHIRHSLGETPSTQHRKSLPTYAPHPFGVYQDKLTGELTDPPHPKQQAIKKGTTMHRLKDGGPLCNSRTAYWYAYPDELPTCENCIRLSQVTQS